jgi:predicted dehydrogenase
LRELLGKKVQVAVIGTGGIAKRSHVPAYLSNEFVNLVALVDIDYKKAKQVAKKFKVSKVYSSVDKLFENEEIDAVSVCTPPHTHRDIVLRALNYGAHVFCEKPLATDVESGKVMVEASIAMGKILMVGFHRRFSPNYQKAKQFVSDGRLGHVYCVMDTFIQPNPLFGWGKSRWYLNSGIGGVINDLAPHVFDMLNYIFNDFPIAVSAYSFAYMDSPVEEYSVFLVEYPKGRLGIGVVSWLSSVVMEHLSIYGTAQNLFISPSFFLKASPTNILEISLLRAATESLISLKFPHMPMLRIRRANVYKLEIDYFIRQIRKGVESHTSALNALSVLIACDRAKKAIKKNRRIEIPSPNEILNNMHL